MASFSARREDHFQKEIVQNGSSLFYLFLANKMVVCFVLFVATLSDFGLLFLLIEALIELRTLRKMLLRKQF